VQQLTQIYKIYTITDCCLPLSAFGSTPQEDTPEQNTELGKLQIDELNLGFAAHRYSAACCYLLSTSDYLLMIHS
jgi:hypothetical protein